MFPKIPNEGVHLTARSEPFVKPQVPQAGRSVMAKTFTFFPA